MQSWSFKNLQTYTSLCHSGAFIWLSSHSSTFQYSSVPFPFRSVVFSSGSDLHNNGTSCDPHSKPAVPELGVLSSVLKGDEAHSWTIVRKCMVDLEQIQREYHSDDLYS